MSRLIAVLAMAALGPFGCATAAVPTDAGDAGVPDRDADVAVEEAQTDADEVVLVRCNLSSECDDGVYCNGAEECLRGFCNPGVPPGCHDGILCTVDACVEAIRGCTNTPDHTLCPPAELCTVASGGCVRRPCSDASACDDAVFCDGAEQCVAGWCEGGPNPCDDANPCTRDACDETVGCSNAPEPDADGDGFAATACGGTDCNDMNAAIHPGATEACNGIDDDCNGACDDGFACCLGVTADCVTPCASRGRQTCASGCVLGPCIAPTETCNGLDDDCDGTCDNGFACCQGAPVACTTACGTAGTHPCDPTCSFGAGTCCAAAETCNGCDDNCDGVIDEGCPPLNEDCSSAAVLTLGAARTTVNASTALAGDSAGTCSTAPDVWYRFTLTQREIVFINTYGSSFDTALGIRPGTCAGAQTCNGDACSTTASELVQNLAAGDYFLVVDGGVAGANGDYRLNIEHLPVANDGMARALASGTSSPSGTTSGTGLVAGSCGGTGPEHLYYFTECPAFAGGSLSARTCNTGTSYNTLLYLRSGATGVDVVCNDDALGCTSPPVFGLASNVIATLTAAEGLYGLYVDGASGAAGNYLVNATRP